MATLAIPRRRFFRRMMTVLGGSVAVALGGRFLLPRQRARQRALSVPLTDIPRDGALVYRESRVALLRENDRVIALSLVCTHLGCTLTVTPRELVCPCHGSRFDHGGAVLVGPATRPLHRHAVREVGDRVEVLLGDVTGERA